MVFNLRVCLSAIAASFAVLTPIFALAGIWSGDERFGYTAGVLAPSAFFMAFLAFLLGPHDENDTGW